MSVGGGQPQQQMHFLGRKELLDAGFPLPNSGSTQAPSCGMALPIKVSLSSLALPENALLDTPRSVL